MDEEIIVNAQKVQWDTEKDASNRKKHHISFRAASYVFSDANRIELFDEEHSEYEDRYKVIGSIGKVIFVVYTERGDAHRIISARLATAKERRLYYGCL